MARRGIDAAKFVHDCQRPNVHRKIDSSGSVVPQDVQAEAAVRDHLHVLQCAQNLDSDARRVRLRDELVVLVVGHQLRPGLLALVRVTQENGLDPRVFASKEELGQVLDLAAHFDSHLRHVYADYRFRED